MLMYTSCETKPRYQTWDSFLVSDGNDPKNPYLTEAGPHVFDAALELHQNDVWSPKEAGTVVRTDVFTIVCTPDLQSLQRTEGGIGEGWSRLTDTVE